MGLSSSQGRLLMLTARLSDIELQQIMISQRQNRLAWDQEKVAKEYSEAMNNYKLMIKVPDLESDNANARIQKELTLDNLYSAGYIVADAQGNIYLTKNEDGKWYEPEDIYGKKLLTIEGDEAIINEKSLEDTEEVDGEESTPASSKSYKIIDGGQMLKKSEVLEQQIMSGHLYLVNTKDATMGLTPELLEADKDVMWVLDTSDDAKAESIYNYETTQLERKENLLEMELKQLETQHEAIVKEIESVDKVISSNIDRTFKLFSDG